MLKTSQTYYIKNIYYATFIYVYIRILYGMTKFVEFADRLTTCQFLCLTAAVKAY